MTGTQGVNIQVNYFLQKCNLYGLVTFSEPIAHNPSAVSHYFFWEWSVLLNFETQLPFQGFKHSFS